MSGTIPYHIAREGIRLLLIAWLYTQLAAFTPLHAQPIPQEPPGRSTPSPVSLTPEELDYLSELGLVKMCVDPDWEPYERINEAGEHEGIAGDLMRLIAQRAGVSLVLLSTVDWSESLERSRSGDCHILSFLNQTPERDEWLLFTEPYFTNPMAIITREEHDFVFDLARLTDETVALPAGTSIEERIRGNYPNLAVITADSEREALQLVVRGQADLSVRPLTMAAYTMRQEGLFDLKIAGQVPEYTNYLRIGVVKDQPMLRDILDKAVATLTSREVDEILNHHITVNVTVVTPVNYPLVFGVAGGVLILGLLGLLWSWHIRRMNALLRRKNDEHRQAELTRQASEEHFEQFFANAPIGVFRTTPQGHVLTANPAMARMLGYDSPPRDHRRGDGSGPAGLSRPRLPAANAGTGAAEPGLGAHPCHTHAAAGWTSPSCRI